MEKRMTDERRRRGRTGWRGEARNRGKETEEMFTEHLLSPKAFMVGKHLALFWLNNLYLYPVSEVASTLRMSVKFWELST